MTEGFDFWVLLGCLLFLVLSLLFEWFKTALTFVMIVAVISLTGILSPDQVLQQIANEQIAVILMLMILGNIMRRSVLIDTFFKRIFKDGIGVKGFIGRIYFWVGGLSGFFNNTPLVAILMPHIVEWGKRNNISPSKLLMPLSYASIMGGGITLIGTSTNLIVDRFYRDSGGQGFELFDFAIIGIPLFLFGFVYSLFSSKLLPSRVKVGNDLLSRDYLVETKIKDNANIIGKTVEEANLRSLKNLYLVEIIRNSKRIQPISPKEILKKGDQLMFAGDTSKVIEFLTNHPELDLNNTSMEIRNKQEVIEAVVPYNSPLVNMKINESNFRQRFDAAIIGVRRNGEKLTGKIGELEVKRGDMFLCITGKDFDDRVDKANDLYVVSKVQNINNIGVKTSLLVIGAMILAMALAGLKVTSLFNSMVLMLVLIAMSGMVPFGELKKSFSYNFLLIGGGALVFGKAMTDTGVANYLASNLISFFTELGSVGTLLGLFLVTNLLASFMTNIAAVAIVYPIAVIVANSLGLDLFLVSMMIAFGGSKIFLTSIGYQTNLMVSGPGGYKAIDYVRYGGIKLVLVIILIYLLLEFVLL